MPSEALAKLLTINAAYTAVCGIISLGGSSALAGPFGLSEQLPLQAVGVFLIVVAAAMGAAAKLVSRSLVPALLLTVGDAGYVAASVGAVVLAPLSGTGKAVTIAVAAIVVVFVVLQGRALAAARSR